MKTLNALKSVSTLTDLAMLLNYKPASLAYILYKTVPAAKYTTFIIPKKSGGQRTIDAPIPQLKVLQQKLATLLQDIWDEIQQAHKRRDTIAHGFRRGRSIVTNARKHRNKRFVLNVDLQDFFPSLNFGRVRGYFIKDHSLQLDPKVATLIAQIACHQNALPQGSPCSPVISNFIGHILDVQLAELAARHSCTYSRYADDLTFSTNETQFPASIADTDPSNVRLVNAGAHLLKIVTKNNFAINPLKTRLQFHDSRQMVTGLIVNRRVNVAEDYRHKIRAMAHRLFQTGQFNLHTLPTPGRPEQLHGMFSFIDAIDLQHHYLRFANSDKHDTLGKPISKISVVDFGKMTSQHIGPLTRRERLFRRFLMYKEFYAAPKPVIVCEGESDNVYLLHAIHSLGVSFPQLLSPPAPGQSRLKVRLFKFMNTRTGRLLGLGSGGGSVLKTLIEQYTSETRHFKVLPSSSPCILLLDNDSGSKGVQALLKKRYSLSIPPTGFVNVHKNLYVMRTPPLPAQQDTAIEDFFTPATRALPLAGKFLSLEKDFDTAHYYGKIAFAHSVIRPNAASIDFSGFVPILQTIVDIIHDRAAQPSFP
jgi:RNA-directed DNA polymerase